MKGLGIRDVPQGELDRIKALFEAAPQVRQLRVRQGILQRQGQYRAALDIGRQLDAAYCKAVADVLEEANRECERVELSSARLPQDIAGRLDEILVTLQLAIDIMDTCVMDFNDTLHNVDGALTLESFDDIRDLGRKVRMKMDGMRKNSKVFTRIDFAERSDNMYKLLRNKARSLINKSRKNGD